MKYRALLLLTLITFFFACKDDMADNMNPDEPVYIQDNIFGCDQFEVMETDASFMTNQALNLEVFNQLFVYEDHNGLVVKDGFQGPTLQSYELQVKDLVLFNDQLMVCAEEGLYSMDATGELTTITEQRCFSIALDGQGRLMVQGAFGSHSQINAYAIHEFKNGTLTFFTHRPYSLSCLNLELIGGNDQSLYAITCSNGIARYENGVLEDALPVGEAPLFAADGALIAHQYYDGGLIALTLNRYDAFRMYKLTNLGWSPIYNLAHRDEITEKRGEVFEYGDNNIFIHNDYVYTFRTGGEEHGKGIARFDISGDEQKRYEDIDLVEIPGLKSRDLIDIIIASDGHAYAVMRGRKIVKISC